MASQQKVIKIVVKTVQLLCQSCLISKVLFLPTTRLSLHYKTQEKRKKLSDEAGERGLSYELGHFWTNWSKCVTFPTWQWCLSGWGVSDGVVMNSDQLGRWWCDMREHSHNQSDVMGLARDTSNQDNHNFIISCGSSSSSDSFSPVSHSCTKQSLQELQGLVESFPLSLFTVPHLLGGKVVLGNSRRHFKWVIQMYGERFRHLNYNLIWQISLSCLSFSEWQTGKIVWS